RPQALGEDDPGHRLGGAVEEDLRRERRRQPQVHRHGVALARPYPAAVGRQREPPLVVVLDDVVELLARDPHAVAGTGREQRVHLHPAAVVQRDTDPLRLVPEHLREVLRDPDDPRALHRRPPCPPPGGSPNPGPAYDAWLTELMLKSGTRSGGIA